MKQSWKFLDDKEVVEKDTVGSTTSLNLFSRLIAESLAKELSLCNKL